MIRCKIDNVEYSIIFHAEVMTIKNNSNVFIFPLSKKWKEVIKIIMEK